MEFPEIMCLIKGGVGGDPKKRLQFVQLCSQRHQMVSRFLIPLEGYVGKTIVVLTLFLTACGQVPLTFAPQDPIPVENYSPDLLNKVLQEYVHDGEVDYSAIRKDPRFALYLALLDRVDPNQLSDDRRLAFWINAYNAFAIKGILDGLTPAPYVGWFRYFKLAEYRVGGRTITLSYLEHEVLRAQFREPRIHFAIVCASRSCPELRSSVYRGEQLDEQLESAARTFINDASRNRFDRKNKIVQLSMIFKWFAKDFEAEAGSLLGYVRRYVADSEVAQELLSISYEVEFLDYDWSLNGIAPREYSDASSSR